jgi:hypothetical protein
VTPADATAKTIAVTTLIAAAMTFATAIATTTAGSTTAATLCQNHVTFKLVILDIGNHRCLIPVAVARQQVRRDRAPGRKGHEQQP